MMRRFCLLIIILWSGKSFAQVNLPTGSATFNLPIFNWQDNKSRLNSIVELDYNSANGLKVNDVASNVGEGWNLLQGGVITRIQVGEPDDQKEYHNGSLEQIDDVTKYPAGFLYTDTDPLAFPGCPESLTKYPIFKDRDHLYKQHNGVARDGELDYFAFSFNGRSGMCALDKSSLNTTNQTCNFVSLGDSKLKIWCKLSDLTTNQIRTTIDSIFIQDENGLIYTFATHEVTQVLSVHYCNSTLNATYTQPKFKSGHVYHEASYTDNNIVYPNIISGWHLSKIQDPLTHRSIVFNYTTENIHADAGTGITYFDHPNNYCIISQLFSYSQTPRISTINYPDGHQAIFNYGTERIDMKGDFILSSVDIKYQNRFLSKYLLKTTYVVKNRYANAVSDFETKWARLYLRSVQKVGVDLKGEDDPYVFDYFLGSSAADDYVPPPFYHIKDVWGYYNGDNNYEVNGTTPINLLQPLNDFSNVQLQGLCYIRDHTENIVINPKDGYAKNGLLRQITYPTGGSLTYAYAQNYSFNGTQNVIAGGVHVSSTTLTDGGYANDCNHPIVTNYNYTLDDANLQSSMIVGEAPINVMQIQNHYSPQERKFHVASLSCKYKYQYPGILARDQRVNLTTGQQILSIVSTVATVVGYISEICDIVKLCATSTGPGAVIIDVIVQVLQAAWSCASNGTIDNTRNIYYNYDLNSSNPLPLQFKKLQVVQNSGTNGKIVYDFTTSEDYPYWIGAAGNTSFSMKQRFPSWAYGLIKKITYYDAAATNPLKQTENIYDPEYLKEPIAAHFLSKLNCTKCLVTASASQKSTDWASNNNPANTDSPVDGTYEKMMVDEYSLYTGRLPLQTTYERTFKPGSSTDYQENSVRYDYNSNYLVSNITTTLSNGDLNYKAINYDNELLTANNIIATPSETTTAFTKSGSYDKYYTGESVTEFSTIADGNIVPSASKVQRFSAPVISSSMKYYPDAGGTYHTTQTMIYDIYGNLEGLKDEGNHVVSNIYDYNDKYAVASVINADPNLDKAAYTSFETNDFSRSGWIMNGTAVYNSGSSVTGTNCLTLSSGESLSASLNTLKPYKLSFWSSNSGISVAGNATLVKSAPTLNGFTYYEYNIAQGTSSVTVSGSANIDELRLYPQNARMRTVTYDPLIGKTSECDENNRITYYEYDDLGRMRFIKDENKNVVKMYEYNVKSKIAGCPATYHNLAVTEVFTRNNCGTGYVGTDTTYTIPDSKYTSTVSQDEVDQKVQDELDAMGQAFANANGSCKLLYYNDPLSEPFTKEGCDDGYKGTSITYTVPGNKYFTTVSKDSANALAQEEIDANGQAFANAAGNASCVVDTAPDYEGDENAPTQCQQSNGFNTGHQLILVTDVNPNSATYNQTQWADMGVNTSACPAPSVYVKLSYENTIYAGAYQYQDIVARFYSDAQCTVPVSVNDLDVYYHSTTYDEYGGELNEHSNDTYCTGNTYVLVHQAMTYYSLGAGNYEYTEYYLDPDPTSYYAPIQ
jgi:hypothetical protein